MPESKKDLKLHSHPHLPLTPQWVTSVPMGKVGAAGRQAGVHMHGVYVGLYLHPRDVRCRIPCHIRQTMSPHTVGSYRGSLVRPKVLVAGPDGVSYNKWGVTRRRAHDGTRHYGEV